VYFVDIYICIKNEFFFLLIETLYIYIYMHIEFEIYTFTNAPVHAFNSRKRMEKKNILYYSVLILYCCSTISNFFFDS